MLAGNDGRHAGPFGEAFHLFRLHLEKELDVLGRGSPFEESPDQFSEGEDAVLAAAWRPHRGP